LVLAIWFLVNHLKTNSHALAVQERCRKPVGSVLLSICLTCFMFSMHIPAAAVSKQSPPMLRHFLLYRHICVVACVILFIFYDCAMTFATLSVQLHALICNMQQTA